MKPWRRRREEKPVEIPKPLFGTGYGHKDPDCKWTEGDIVYLPSSRRYNRIQTSGRGFCRVVPFDIDTNKTDWSACSNRFYRNRDWELYSAANSDKEPERELCTQWSIEIDFPILSSS